MSQETLSALTLVCLKGLSASMAMCLYKKYESATLALEHLDEVPARFRKKVLEALPEAQERAKVELEFCKQKNIQVLIFSDEGYPARLRECEDAPLVLFYRGIANLNEKRIISVVGTRKISGWGKSICQNFCKELAALIPDCVVVSGLAYGVDIHSHRACLENSLPTVAVLAHGLDRIYPSLHRSTAIEMLNQGGLLTEFLSGTNPDKGNFVRRNRIVAGMADATIVIESAAHGGAMITARLANGYGRDVFAFPGRITDPMSEGCLKLIKANVAALITGAGDVVEAMNWAPA
ncbi:MAG: DNA-processing protein DprA, partial [Bacteroidaceae bacterium]|nr:DNA-processing protein DprA [Bacteroidaceae bacterium]